METTASSRNARSFGFWLVLLVDGLFYLGVLAVFLNARLRVYDPVGTAARPRGGYVARPPGAWPDVPPENVPSPAWALAAAGAVLAAALLHRLRKPAPVVALALAAACGAMPLYWREALAGHGMLPKLGQYAALAYVATVLWWLHAWIGLAAAGVAAAGRRPAAETPLLGRFLMFQAVAGLVLVGGVLTW
jgi:heme/copper-type cytochrome/quinol oxidase subunit 3